MKEMSYEERSYEILDHDDYKGFEYYIIKCGSHPTAYVKIPADEKKSEYIAGQLFCHGGITYNEKYLNLPDNDKREEKGYRWIGWDYAHGMDALIGIQFGYKNKKYTQIGHQWSTEEILKEVKSVIEQLELLIINI